MITILPLLLAIIDITLVDQFAADTTIASTAVAIVEGDQVLLSKGYGDADADTIFQLASVTKPFTATGVGLLVQDKKLTWDEPVIRKFPEFLLFDRYATRYANSRDLLSHTTGLPAFGGDLLPKLGYTNSEILTKLSFLEPAVSFREEALYSNAGYFLAGELIQSVSGLPWDQFLQKNLLDPLGMTRSGFADNLQRDNVAKAHVNGKVVPWDITGGFPAAGAVTSTANDMAKFMSMFLTGGKGILKPETIEALFTPTAVGEISFSETPPISSKTGFFFTPGWDVYYYRGHLIVEKGGGLDGIRTLVTLIPSLSVGITVLSNENLTLYPEKVRSKFLEILFGPDDLDGYEEKEKILKNLLVAPENKGIPLPRPLVDYIGTFENPVYGKFVVKEEGNDLIILGGPAKLKGTLEHVGNNTFNLRWPYVNSGYSETTFLLGPNGRAESFYVENHGTFRRQ